MRSIWKGDLSFGLVNVPVKVYSATESHDRESHQVDAKDGTRIRYRRVRQGSDDEVDYADIANSYDSESGKSVILTKEDLAGLPVSRSPEISITDFVPSEQVDPVFFDKPYYLEPSSRSPKAYVLLRQALEDTDRMAIATFTLRNRTRLAALRVVDDVLTLHTLLWPDEVRAPEFAFLDEDVEIRPQELSMASSLIQSMSEDFDPGKFRDTYQDELAQLIEAKAGGTRAFDETVPPGDATDDDSEVADLLAALRASVRDRESESTLATQAPAKKTPAKKTPANKAPAKKAPAKKSAAKKSASKTTTAKTTATKKATAKKAMERKAG